MPTHHSSNGSGHGSRRGGGGGGGPRQTSMSQFVSRPPTQSATTAAADLDRVNASIIERVTARMNAAYNTQGVQHAKQEAMRLAFGDEGDEDIEVTHKDISLLCPIAASRIKTIPVRGEGCRHTQCFDLEAWLEFISKTRRLRDPSSKCPICQVHVQASTLVVDPWIKSVLAETEEAQTKVIELYPNGTYDDTVICRKRGRDEIDLRTQLPTQQQQATSPAAVLVRIKQEPRTSDRMGTGARDQRHDGPQVPPTQGGEETQDSWFPHMASANGSPSLANRQPPESQEEHHGLEDTVIQGTAPDQRPQEPQPTSSGAEVSRRLFLSDPGSSGTLSAAASGQTGAAQLVVTQTQEQQHQQQAMETGMRTDPMQCLEVVVTQTGAFIAGTHTADLGTGGGGTQPYGGSSGGGHQPHSQGYLHEIPLRGARPYCDRCQCFVDEDEHGGSGELTACSPSIVTCCRCGTQSERTQWTHVLDVPARVGVVRIELSIPEDRIIVTILKPRALNYTVHSALSRILSWRQFIACPDGNTYVLENAQLKSPQGHSFVEGDYLIEILSQASQGTDPSKVPHPPPAYRCKWWN